MEHNLYNVMKTESLLRYVIAIILRNRNYKVEKSRYAADMYLIEVDWWSGEIPLNFLFSKYELDILLQITKSGTIDDDVIIEFCKRCHEC